MLKEVNTNEDIKIFGTYKLELIKLHQKYANNLGLVDNFVDNYSYDDAIKNINEENYFEYLISYNNKNIGVLEYKIIKSDIDNEEIIYIDNIYIKQEYRGLGIGKNIINELKKQGKRIELECWYGMPANYLYRSLGMKELKTRYMMDK